MPPDAAEKVGPGVDHVRVIATPRGNQAVLVNGGRVAFSYQKYLEPPTHKQRVLAAMRVEIQPQVYTYFESRLNTGQPMATDDTRVPYFRGPGSTTSPCSSQGRPAAGTPSRWSGTDRKLALFADRALAERWHAHHCEHTVLGLLTSKENQRHPCM
ncbi:DUF3223 domain-containing protein [Streptomyces lateritius]|uniref:DUF3223 domain-containing protein n=1 Tax=Streptomyces lateritius TaxID=67313 RepID=UPI0016726A4E|nr:DUF3223 domain-containing protein [Streptomyces lateritius]